MSPKLGNNRSQRTVGWNSRFGKGTGVEKELKRALRERIKEEWKDDYDYYNQTVEQRKETRKQMEQEVLGSFYEVPDDETPRKLTKKEKLNLQLEQIQENLLDIEKEIKTIKDIFKKPKEHDEIFPLHKEREFEIELIDSIDSKKNYSSPTWLTKRLSNVQKDIRKNRERLKGLIEEKQSHASSDCEPYDPEKNIPEEKQSHASSDCEPYDPEKNIPE